MIPNLTKHENNLQEIKAARCTGVIDGTALQKENNSIVSAYDVTKTDGPFYCPVCLCEVVVRKCTDKEDHFAHHARQSPIIRKCDRKLHNQCRDEILEYLKQIFPNGNWAAERAIVSKDERHKTVIPDISGRIDGKPIAIEIQLSPYSIKKIYQKVTEYRKRKISVLYIIPLREELGDKSFRPRLFEKYLHSMYYGKVYYWTPNRGTKIIPIHYSPSKRWIDESQWYDVNLQTEITVGGYYLTYKTLKEPNYGKQVDIAKDFTSLQRPRFEPKNAKKTVPECTIYQDTQKPWWNKDEYADTKIECEKLKENQEFLSQYEYIDDYDSDENG